MTENELKNINLAREELSRIYDDRENSWEQLISNIEKALSYLDAMAAKDEESSQPVTVALTIQEFAEAKTWPTLTKEDVWGDYEKGTKGMIVARSGDICPVFHDKVPYKSVTVICDESQRSEVEYWLGYVHGVNCVSIIRKMPDEKLAIRSNYQCW